LPLSLTEILSIVAFVPVYQEGVGQELKIYCQDGTVRALSGSMKAFVRQLARFFSINLAEMRKRFGPLLGQVNLVPLALAPFLLFVPLKVRKPRLGGDPAYGYFKLRSLTDVRAEPAPCTVKLIGGHQVTLQQSHRAVRIRLQRARQLEALALEQHCRIIEHSHSFFVPEKAWLSLSLQENLCEQGIKSANGHEEGNTLELHNLMETVVLQRLDEVLGKNQTGFCNCAQCRLDVVALALNSLPARYVVTERGAVYASANSLGIQHFVDVVAALTKALQVVRQKPRH